MIYITQLVYVRPGEEETFHQFEEVAMPVISRYNGKLLLRIRPDRNAIISSLVDEPYEIHLVEFTSDDDFENFKRDDERKKFLHLKEKSVRSVLLIKGEKL
jgi:uncharacterized protein (DUF1330 family)